MKATAIQINHTYEITAGRNKTTVKVVGFDQRNGSWLCETQGGKAVSVKDPKRFLKEIGVKANVEATTKKTKHERNDNPDAAEPTSRHKGGKPSGKMSALDAAHEVLLEAGRPMNAKEITELAISSGRWSPAGATPSATLSAAIQMDVIKKQEASRFVKAGRGLFAAK